MPYTVKGVFVSVNPEEESVKFLTESPEVKLTVTVLKLVSPNLKLIEFASEFAPAFIVCVQFAPESTET